MSQVGLKTPSNLNEGYPVTNLTLVVLSLIPCVVVLLFLNCLFLGYKLFVLSKKRRKKCEDPDEILLHSALSARHRLTRINEAPYFQNHDGRRTYVSVSEPILHHHPVTSSRTSSKDRAPPDQRIRFLRPDGATGSGSLRAPSTIMSPSPGCPIRVDLPRSARLLVQSRTGCCRSAPLLPQSSDSEVDSRANLVPNNSPDGIDPLPTQVLNYADPMRRSSTLELLVDIGHDVADNLFDKMEMESECLSCNLPETSGLHTSTVGPGLDSDFGASAGVSLRIMSADSDGLSNGVPSSALEWDYYDPCYVRQNNIPKHNNHTPAIHTKQYWV